MKPLYSKLGIKYQQAYSGPHHDLSYAVGDNRMILSIKNGKLSGFGRPAICLGDSGKLIKNFKKIYQGNVWYMDYLEGGLTEISRFLLKEGVVPKPYYTQIIDLTQTEEQLHSQLRKSYKHLANTDDPQVFVTSESVDWLKDMHIRICGKQTRSDETWELQKEMVRQGEALVVTSHSAAGLFLYNSESCYYGVGKGEPAHPVIWRAILHAKAIGCKEFEMGQQVYGNGKDANISNFKRGFGGKTVVRLEFGSEV